MRGPLPPPGRTGVRIAGDHYQWLVAWSGCLTVLHDDAEASNPVLSLGVEVDGVGNLDDVVLTRAEPPHTHMQIKYAVDSSSPVNTEWLTEPTPAGGPCLLRRTARSWQRLTVSRDPVDLRIVTNRAPDPTDILVAGRDARTGLLLPKAAGQTATSDRGKARSAWADAAGIDEGRLLELLSVLHFDLSRDLALLEQMVSLQMFACGLRGDPTAVLAGTGWIAQQVRNGRRVIDLLAIEAAIQALGLRQGQARAVLSIATLKPDPLAGQSEFSLDWVDRFDGDDAYSKRRPKPPATWQQLQDDINAIPARLTGTRSVLVTGSLRQATAFAVGASLRLVTGVDLATVQRGELWASSSDYDAAIPLVAQEYPVGTGDDLAVALQVATQIHEDVLDFLRASPVHVDRLLVLGPEGGPKDNAVKNAEAANALAVGVRDAVRAAVKGHPQVHLFLAGPMGLSLLLAHRWNRVAPTIVYEDVGASLGYKHAFTVNA